MGRAMIIICAGMLISLGYVTLGTNQQTRQVMGSNAGYAEMVQARNAAHTGIQIVMQKIDSVKALNEGTNWWDNHYDENTAWTDEITGSTVKVYVDTINVAAPGNSYWQPDTVRVISTATYVDPITGTEELTKVVSTYKTNSVDDYMPDFKGALVFATNEIIPVFNSSVSISGNDASGTCADMPAIVVRADIDPDTKADIEAQMGNLKEVAGILQTDPALSYEPVNEVIDRLEVSEGIIYISGFYKGSMGTATDPGVFFVEDKALITSGIVEGYGILVITSDGYMKYMDENFNEVDIAGKLTFNGLVIFENAFSLQGRNIPSINGSILVGHTADYLETIPADEMTIDLNGDLHLQYNCKGEDYAKMAAALIIKQRRFRRLSTFE